ncbi:hypothetical protein BC936DRAFT_145348 [Jimgerdemannia flammicorona]|uniref:Uncharacterized protein n=1 Tax=Jimgerdemannia flammicorona TaxID=994334 RepID=A0A433DA66_9FUNG|nr:hypothetical protein BC936DRAFT_145348 [Jimgerdemannia flammicorona]
MLAYSFIICSIMTLLFGTTEAGPLAYGLCQTACNAAWVSCYASLGLVAGKPHFVFEQRLRRRTLRENWLHEICAGVASALGCNFIQGVCMTSCAASFLLPIP